MGDVSNRAIFGELSLILESKRTASVKTSETSYVLVIPESTFKRYMREPILKKLNILIQFYWSFSFFDYMETSTLLILASKTFVTLVQSNTLIFRQDNKVNSISFIKRGRCKVLRCLDFVDYEGYPIHRDNYQKLFQPPKPYHREIGKVKQL